METKLFEVRDRMTFMPVLCVRLNPGNEADRYLLGMAGYGTSPEEQGMYTLYGPLASLEMTIASADHPSKPRTHSLAHQHIEDNWDELQSGEVIDVEFVAEEVQEPKKSQRLDQC